MRSAWHNWYGSILWHFVVAHARALLKPWALPRVRSCPDLARAWSHHILDMDDSSNRHQQASACSRVHGDAQAWEHACLHMHVSHLCTTGRHVCAGIGACMEGPRGPGSHAASAGTAWVPGAQKPSHADRACCSPEVQCTDTQGPLSPAPWRLLLDVRKAQTCITHV